jgi:amidase
MRIRQSRGVAERAVPEPAMRSDRGGGRREGRCILAVNIESIRPRGPQPVGTSALIPDFGGLVGTAHMALLSDPLPERVKKMEVTEKGVRFNACVTLPYEPFIGTLGVSPQIEAVTSLQPDYWGGNMDLPDVGPGAIVYFPVHQ